MHGLQWDYSFPGHHTGTIKLIEEVKIMNVLGNPASTFRVEMTEIYCGKFYRRIASLSLSIFYYPP
jgi:hypothetical protein